MIKKHILMLIVVFLLLYLATTYYVFDATRPTKINKINLLENNYHLVYGKLISKITDLQIKLDEFGEALVLFNTDTFKVRDFSQVGLTVNGLSKNYQVRLEWVNNLDGNLYNTKLLQPDGSLKKSILFRISYWSGETNQIALRFVPQSPLGLDISSNGVITIKEFVLDNYGYTKNIATLYSYWLDYDAWSYKSLHHLKNNPILPAIAHPVFFIFVWLLICLTINKTIFERKLKPFLIILFAWIFLSAISLHNNIAKTKWVKTAYGAGNFRLPDENLKNISEKIKSKIKINENSNSSPHNKLLILSTDRYKTFRLIYHMLPLNSSFLNAKTTKNESVKLRNNDYILSYDVENKHIKPFNGILNIKEVDINVKEIASGTNYSLLQVIK